MKTQVSNLGWQDKLAYSENSSLHLLFSEVHLHVWLKLNNLNSFYKINTPSLRMVSLNVKLHSPQQCLLVYLFTFSSCDYSIQREVITDIIRRVTRAH